jgi:2-oxoglutarate ferredoxin oxidoreductase subunit beta
MATATATPWPRSGPKTNHIGLQVLEYRGGKTTLCAGCGHNAISERIIDAMYEMGVQPERVMKLSGIGCSSKSPAYFMSRSHSFNSVHGRMPSVSTGAMLANHTMKALGVSGDGDTASIGMGQFVHLMRRNLPMIYIIEDNGVYGLTKGQFSATADIGSKLKTGVSTICRRSIPARWRSAGRDVRGRSFSGDKKQLLAMLKAAIAHKGTVMLDVISLRDLQRSRGLDQELQVHAGARRADQRGRLRAQLRRDRSRLRSGTTLDVRCTTAPACVCASCTRTTTRPTASAR